MNLEIGKMDLPLSVGEFNVRLLRLQLKLCTRGGAVVPAASSTGKHVSTIASKQFTNNSDDSPIKLYYIFRQNTSTFTILDREGE